MKRLVLAAALALIVHGLFFSFVPKLGNRRLPVTPQHLTVTFSIRQAPQGGPGPELEHPVPPPDEMATVSEPDREPPVVRQEPSKEPAKPPDKAVPPAKKAPAPRPKAKANAAPQKRKATSSQKKQIPEKKERIIPSSVLETQPHSEATPGPEAMAEPDAAHGMAVSPVAPGKVESGDLLPGIPGLTSKVVRKSGAEAASVQRAETIITATPAYRDNPRPEYPRLAKRRGYEGTVLLEVLVSRAGKVEDLRIARSSGHRILDRSAMKSVKEWVFDPGSIGGRKMDMWVKVPVRFELK